MKSKVNITFDSGSSSFVMDALGLKKGKDGYLVNKRTNREIKDVNGEYIKPKEFGGFGKASKHYVKKDAFSLLKLKKIIDK